MYTILYKNIHAGDRCTEGGTFKQCRFICILHCELRLLALACRNQVHYLIGGLKSEGRIKHPLHEDMGLYSIS